MSRSKGTSNVLHSYASSSMRLNAAFGAKHHIASVSTTYSPERFDSYHFTSVDDDSTCIDEGIKKEEENPSSSHSSVAVDPVDRVDSKQENISSLPESSLPSSRSSVRTLISDRETLYRESSLASLIPSNWSFEGCSLERC